jgi:hypothetical protein
LRSLDFDPASLPVTPRLLSEHQSYQLWKLDS